MTQDEIIDMARQVGIEAESDTLCRFGGWVEPFVAFANLVAAKALAQTQEPIAMLFGSLPVYDRTTPPQRKPLTDKAITKVIDSMPKKMKGFGVDWDLYEFARAIEAAHGIKGDA